MTSAVAAVADPSVACALALPAEDVASSVAAPARAREVGWAQRAANVLFGGPSARRACGGAGGSACARASAQPQGPRPSGKLPASPPEPQCSGACRIRRGLPPWALWARAAGMLFDYFPFVPPFPAHCKEALPLFTGRPLFAAHLREFFFIFVFYQRDTPQIFKNKTARPDNGMPHA